MNRKVFRTVGAALAASALVLTASIVVAGASSKPHSTDSVQAEAQAKVKAYMKVPALSQWPTLTTSYAPGHHKAEIISCGFTTQTCVQEGTWAGDALKAMGWTAPPAENDQNSTTVEAADVTEAAQQKVAAIVLVAIDVNSIPSAVKQALSDGIKISCIFCDSGPQWKGKIYDVTNDWVTTGTIGAWETLALEGSKANTVQFLDPEFSAIVQQSQGAEAVYKKYCPTCTLTTLNINGTQLGEPGPPPWTAYLAAHPAGSAGAANNVIAMNDGVELVVGATDKSDGVTLPVGSYDGATVNLDGLATGKPFPISWEVSEPLDFFAWAAANAVGLAVNGKSVPVLSNLPSVLVTKSNVKSFLGGNPKGSDYVAPSGNWQAKFKALWK
jgi:ABC-type sugar transport system substrate-binding protein